MSSTDDNTFAALRSDPDSPVTPDAVFAARLQRQVRSALTTPDIELPPRKETPMTDPTPTLPPAPQVITPYISVDNGAAALDWYVDALGAVELVRYVGDDGRLGHGEFTVNGGKVYLSDAYPEMGVVAAANQEGSSCALHVEVTNCDALHDSAVAAGATSLSAPADQQHGSRSAAIMDPFGHRWMLSQQTTTLTYAEINERYDDFEVIEKAGEGD